MLLSTVHRLQQSPLRPPVAEATERTFRDAMRQLAGGVCVVTVGADDERTGLTATSVTSLCADPPTLLVCVNRESSSYQALTRFRAFAVNVFARSRRAVRWRVNAQGFATLPGRQVACPVKWSVLSHRRGCSIRVRGRGMHRAAHARHCHRPRAPCAGRRRVGRARPLAGRL